MPKGSKLCWGVFGAVALAACSRTEKVETRNADGVVTERFTRLKGDTLRQGTYELFDDAGAPIERANYEAGLLDGLRYVYFADGAVQYEETHRAGRFEGPYRAYNPSGTVALEGQYVDDEATGIWTGYYEDGTKKEEVTFRENKENGPFREWYSNGAVKAEGEYRDGDKEDGELRLYTLEGALQKRMFCEVGICRTVWTAQTGTADEG